MNKLLILSLYFICFRAQATELVQADDQTSKQIERKTASDTNLDDTISKSLKLVIEKSASAKGRVAVMDFPSLDGKTTGLSSYISNRAGNKLIEAGRQVVDRAALESIITEQKLQQNSLMDAATAAKIGKLAGAGVFIIGSYTMMSTKFVLTVRALSVETGQFIPGAVAEEIVKPVPADMLTEINELIHISGGKTSSPDLSSSPAEQSVVTMTAEREAELKAEVEFMIAVCRIVKKGLDFGKIIKLAFEHGQLTRESDGAIPYLSGCEDSLGEHSGGYNCSTISSWTFTINSYVNSDETAKAIKGKPISSKIQRWTYNGPTELPGLDQCAPNGSQWNDSRGAALKVNQKKRK